MQTNSRPRSFVFLLYALAIICALALSGCLIPGSLYPLYANKDLIHDDSIVGPWTLAAVGDDKIELAPCLVEISATSYRFTYSAVVRCNQKVLPSPPVKMFRADVHLVELGRRTFVDISSPEWTEDDADQLEKAKIAVPFPLLPVHMFGPITFSPRIAVAKFINLSGKMREDKVTKKLKRLLKMVPEDSPLIITFPTAKLQRIARKHADDRSLFSVSIAGCRLGIDCELEAIRMRALSDPRSADAAVGLALLYMHRDRFEDAWKAWSDWNVRTDKIAPSDEYKYFSLAEQFIEWGHPHEGIAILKALVGQTPNLASAWGYLGVGYLIVGQPRQAITAFTQRHSLDPKYNPHSDIGWGYLELGDPARTKVEFLKANLPSSLGLTYFIEKDYSAASAAFEKEAEGWSPDSIPNLQWQYLTQRHLGKSERAHDILNKFQKQSFNPGSAEQQRARYLLGSISEAQYLASIHPRKGQVVIPEQCAAYFLIAEQALLAGNNAKARGYFQKAVDTKAYLTDEWIAANARLKELSAAPASSGASMRR